MPLTTLPHWWVNASLSTDPRTKVMHSRRCFETRWHSVECKYRLYFSFIRNGGGAVSTLYIKFAHNFFFTLRLLPANFINSNKLNQHFYVYCKWVVTRCQPTESAIKWKTRHFTKSELLSVFQTGECIVSIHTTSTRYEQMKWMNAVALRSAIF